MINVNWAFSLRTEEWHDASLNFWAEETETYIQPLSSLSKDIVDSRKNVVFLKCPAHTDFMKNTFVFKSPIDLNIDIDITKATTEVWCDNIPQPLFDKLIDLRFLQTPEAGHSHYPIIGVDFLNTFTCTEEMNISILPAHMHYNDFTAKTGVIPGSYDISKWTRPIELVFEVKQSKERIEIKKGDALFYVKFNNTSQVKLQKSATPWDEIDICSKLRASNTFKSLKYRYQSLIDYKKSIANNNNS
jgi:hypothetical protein